MSETVVILTDSTLDAELASTSLLYLVDFWADWCAPCHAMTPILGELADDHADQLRVGKLDVHEYPTIADRFDIRSLPTLIFFRAGEPVRRLSGAKRKRQLERELAELAAG